MKMNSVYIAIGTTFDMTGIRRRKTFFILGKVLQFFCSFDSFLKDGLSLHAMKSWLVK